MKRYKILKPVMLSFNHYNEQLDIVIDPRDNDEYQLEYDGSTIWYIDNAGKRWESITSATAIPIYKRDEKIMEVQDDTGE